MYNLFNCNAHKKCCKYNSNNLLLHYNTFYMNMCDETRFALNVLLSSTFFLFGKNP